ncbi:RING-type E3 ubiquitin transferase [Malassezia vespertilionis]|uniref:RING-type E3 ubiquitin transferase n=1 Tax=Malassezia vespertilionis TaxID=2020962 RepID=A0A2N1JAU7_9BASI|nr:RING-type E3 ubiquitin transferase [Malassezia vespertilionis]PKI83674.1 hypothetical protein MVES_002580 [Malassezia vespertilionis]WFD07369.1 RING-type E3 ubiquitin transferase [Malassezia vespertilionis]
MAPAIPAGFDEENCAICLEQVVDRCVLPKCFHSCFCFDCAVEWIRVQQETKKCPLCMTPVGDHILHNLDPALSNFAIFYVHDARTDKPAVQSVHAAGDDALLDIQTQDTPRREPPSIAELQRREEAQQRRKQNRALERRRGVYRNRTFAKHVASNRYTKYTPYPGASGFRKYPMYARLLSVFLQRELQVWPHLDTAFLSYYIPALLSHVDLRSDAMLKCLTEWIGNEEEAQLLVHEMELFVRSGRGVLGLDQYDTSPWLQYE